MSTPRPLRILADPAFRTRRRNPYNWLLYTALARLGATVDEYTRARAFRGGYDIVHLHWPEHRLHERSRLMAIKRTLNLALGLAWARARGARVVWTMHNLRSHDDVYPLIERTLWRLVIPQLDGVISLSADGVALARARFPMLARVPSFVIPHGHYRGVYPNEVGRAEARRRLGIAAEAPVAAFVGQVRAYKNVAGLIAAFRALRRPDAILLVVGRPDPPALEGQLRQLAGSDERVRLHLRFLEDEDLQVYLNAADLVVLPYRQVLNSGSALLALSFDRPVLVPRLGALEELQRTVGDEWVRTYRGAFTADALDEALAWALARRAGPAPLDGLAWEGIGEATLAAFESVAAFGARPSVDVDRAVTTVERARHEQRI